MDTVTMANRDIKSLQPIAQQAAQLFLDECKRRNIPIFVTEYHRSQARQNYLYEQGRTRPGNIVTWTKTSNHTAGYAWDIAVNPPNDLYDSKIIAKAGQVAKELGIEWGGDWKEKDTPHFQVSKNWVAPMVDELEMAVKVLHSNGVINTTSAWNKVENIRLEYVPQLIINYLKYKGVKVCCYNSSLVELYKLGVISDLSSWIGDIKKENVRLLLIKMSKVV